jgi:hypothetical protein
MTAFQQLSRVQLVHDDFLRVDSHIELMNLERPGEAI